MITISRQEISAILSDYRGHHSDFQMDYFITGQHATAYGMYKQAVREFTKRYRALQGMYIDRDELLASANETNKRVRLQVAGLAMSIADTERECLRFLAQAVFLKGTVGELTDDRRAALERDMWTEDIKRRGALEYLAHGRVGMKTLEMVQGLPDSMRASLVLQLQDSAALAKWWLKLEPEITIPQDLEVSADMHALLKSHIVPELQCP